MVDRAMVEGLVESYRLAAATLDELPGPLERELGHATLCQNALRTLHQISAEDEDVHGSASQPLQLWLEELAGDSAAPAAKVSTVEGAVEHSARTVLKHATGAAISGNAEVFAGGIFALVAGIALIIIDFDNETLSPIVASFLAAAIAGGVVYFAARKGPKAGRAMLKRVRTTWADASLLGAAALTVLQSISLAPERRVWLASGEADHPGTPLVYEVRSQTRLVVGAALCLIVAGALLFVIGALFAFHDWDNDRPPI